METYTLFIPKNMTIHQKIVLYDYSIFRAINYTKVRFQTYEFKCIVLSNGSDRLLYDTFSGILIKGILRINNYKLNISL
ncbi:MAG: hypothetical protein DRJ49_07155 [Thermoprotei archaeon]|nr:MAG: hypothetical protein DRJ49_07155 [Thermoprotei archaeon]